ncbi:basic amino acid/polyamine antiporter [Lactococcus garvieae]|jgi:arginine:ornithine antiporter/lysine permease|uniref:basic amino acid/polyamine antiporter n=1 Tax=Lactococcus garvieae TaxID=1363 RepID=UPI0009BF030B|nr:basic amino acid/polyamine antiporter [Lactococcus garvieae]QPS70586.1 amino acid permease [Lactococcus garvieae]
MENKKGIGLIALVSLVVSSAIGGGVFNLSNDLANGATAGGVIVAWFFVGLGILALVLSLNYLIINKPELSGVSDYARVGFGDMVGFLSGWGYWLSTWLGNIAFAVLMMISMDYFFPGKFANANGSLTILAVVTVSIFSWLLALLVSRGVESAAVVNAIVLVCKLIPIFVFMIVGIVMFKTGVFTTGFWNNVSENAQGMVQATGSMTANGLLEQVKSSLMVMIWVFVGIEGAAMMGDRAKKKSDAGRATIIGLVVLLFIYILLSLLPFGYYEQAELAAMKTPGMVYMLKDMLGSFGGALMAIGLVVSVLGAWLSWTMLPVESTTQLANQNLLPKWFGRLNKYNAPSNSLWLTQIFVQFFIIVTFFVANAYNVMVYLCTACIMICYALVGGYMMKHGFEEKNPKNIFLGFIAFMFQALALWLSGWQYVWMASILYVIGFIFYYIAKRENRKNLSRVEVLAIVIIIILSIFAVIGLVTNQYGLRELLGL